MLPATPTTSPVPAKETTDLSSLASDETIGKTAHEPPISCLVQRRRSKQFITSITQIIDCEESPIPSIYDEKSNAEPSLQTSGSLPPAVLIDSTDCSNKADQRKRREKLQQMLLGPASKKPRRQITPTRQREVSPHDWLDHLNL